MLNTQIPSGLQALMQAAQILQQQASPTAPGPQGQQPTVAKQVEQAVAQQAAPQVMPNMQTVGQQAGIAGQMMAQRQQQQQQMAQDPQAVAQMAAQMIQRGIGGLPANMQFREGGIIGYAGEEGSDVRLSPVADRDLPEMEDEDARERRRRTMFGERESIPLPELERREPMPPRRPPPVDASGQRMDAGLGKAYRYAMEQSDRPVGLAQVIQESRPIPSALEGLREAIPAAVNKLREAGSFERYAAGARAAQGGGRTPQPDMESMGYPIPQPKQERQQTGIAAGVPTASPIAPAAPPAAPVATRERPTVAGILAAIPEDEQAKKDIAAREEINRRMLEMRRGQADLAAEGIAALRRSEEERRRLLEERKGQDAFTSLMALARSYRTRGNEYMATQASLEARDEADRVARLANEEAILKLKQAQQARQMGDLELEKKFLDEVSAARQQAQQARMAQAKAEATLAGTTYQTDVQASTAAANRAQDLQLKMADLKQRAEDAKDVKLANQVRLASEGLASAQRKIAQTLKDEFPNYAQIVSLQGISGKLDDNQRKVITDYEKRKRELEASSIAPIEALITKLAKQSGLELPEAKPALSAAPAIRYNAQGQRIQ